MVQATEPGRRPRRLRDAHPTRRGLILAWWGFTVTFGGLRLLTWLIHIHAAGLGNVSSGGVHLHHYLYGILILMIVGILGLVERSPRWHAWLGLAFGIGLALIVDEIALLVELKDVYWKGPGEVSVAVALILIGIGGSVCWYSRTPRSPTIRSTSRTMPPVGDPYEYLQFLRDLRCVLQGMNPA